MVPRFLLLLPSFFGALPVLAQLAPPPPPDSWIQDAKTGCRIRNPAPQPKDSVTWSGSCPNGIAEGTGVLQWFDDERPTDRYEGELRDGWESGHGIATSTVIADRYEGEWRDGWRHGQGIYSFANGDRYEGEWFEGLRTGRGTMVWIDSARYEGEWLDSKPSGQGTYIDAANATFAGNWSRGCFQEDGRKLAVIATARDCGFE